MVERGNRHELSEESSPRSIQLGGGGGGGGGKLMVSPS